MTNPIKTMPYLPRQRNFPNDNAQVLSVELDKSYIEIAQRVNERIIGVFTVNYPVVTGEQWFIQGQPRKQQSLRQVYTFTTTTSINHGINFTQIDGFTRMYGEFTDSSTGNWYGLISGSNVAIVGQRSFYLTPTQIVFLAGAGAPPLTSGRIVLEWLSVIDTNS